MAAVPASSQPSTLGNIASLVGGAANLGGSIYGLINSANLQGTANSATNNIAQIQAQQLGYAKQLQSLMADPSSVTSLPGYQFLENQGIQAIDRSAAAPGGKGLGSGGEMTDLETFGQGLADQFYQQQISTLSTLSGIPNSAQALAQALQTSGAASTGLGSSISGLTSGITGLLTPQNVNTVTGIGKDIYNAFGGGSGYVSDAQIASDAASYPGIDMSQLGSETDASIASDIANTDATSGMDLSSLFSSFSGAGGQAAAAAAGTLPAGMTAAVGAEPTAAELAANSGAVDTSLASGGSGFGVGNALGALGAAYSLYNFANNWQSGSTGSDALSGAETGASVGTAILPGIGTIVGGLIGGAVGAISSAFGGGEKDPETTGFNSFVQANAKSGGMLTTQLNPSQAYQMLAGMMDAKNNTAGHSTNLELVFGRMGEGNFMSQMAGEVNSAIGSGKISKSASPEQIYSSVVEPWLKAKGDYVPADAIISSNGTRNNGTVDSIITQLLGQWQSGALTGSSQVGISGQTIQGLPEFGA